MVKKITCKVIDSVSFSSGKRIADADREFAASGYGSRILASYRDLKHTSSEPEFFRDRLNILA